MQKRKVDGWESREFKKKKETIITKKVIILSTFLALAITWKICSVLLSWSPPTHFSEITNKLRLGNAAPTDTYLTYWEPSGEPEAFLDPETIIHIRQEAVKRASNLVDGDYQPSDAIFSPIRPDRPWFSTTGFYYYFGEASGPHPGVPAEMRSIANPFMLIMPEFWGLSIWGEGNLFWDMSKINDDVLTQKNFPLFPRPQGVNLSLSKKEAEATYNLTQYLTDVNDWTTKKLTADKISFGVVAYNARDWGFNYISQDVSKSQNVVNPRLPTEATELVEHLAWSQTLCGTPEGCNHRSDPLKDWVGVKVSSLPAEAVFTLWYAKPETITATPDFTYRIHYE